ncbi:uncharacterized protein G2W53_028352 [Senna tora]|uniref:Uncharacterized protein n=1 Tax=Senna tora TaxID=362788 RepID=A0A834WAJ8_9FABA|nr:uncharacterized protein G2W53_028352 [Senna tora]
MEELSGSVARERVETVRKRYLHVLSGALVRVKRRGPITPTKFAVG